MPKIKLKPEVFKMISEILKEKATNLFRECYEKACDYLKEYPEFSEKSAKEVCEKALSKISRQRSLINAKLELLRVENAQDEEPFSEEVKKIHEERSQQIEQLEMELEEINKIRIDIINLRDKASYIDRLEGAFMYRSSSWDLIKSYDVDPSKPREEFTYGDNFEDENETKFWDAVMH